MNNQTTSTGLPDNELIRIAKAVELFFPVGSGITLSTLKTESKKGNLAIIRIGNKDFVTKAAIDRMIRKCHVKAKVHASTSESVKPARQSGLSGTDRLKKAQDATPGILAALKTRSKPTYRKSGNRKPDNVIKAKFTSTR